MKLSTIASACILASALATNAYAADISLSGFASLVGGKTLSGNDGFMADRTFSSEGVYDRELSFRPESVMGIQAKGQVSDRVSVTGQILAKGQDGFDATFEWLYATYQLTDETVISAGRFRQPFYYYSDFLDVGYAYYWVRPPVDVYNIGHTSLNGISLYDTRYFGDVGLTSQVWYGTDEITIPGLGAVEDRNDIGMNFTLEYDWLKLRYMHNQKRVVYVGDTLAAGEVELVDLADMSYDAIAFMADYEDFMWRSEFTRLKYTYNAIVRGPEIPISEDVTQDTWYVSMGYNIGDFTPYVTHSYMDGSAAMMSGDVTSNTVGVRWNVEPGTALKLELTKQDMDALVLPSAGIDLSADERKVITIAVDVVF